MGTAATEKARVVAVGCRAVPRHSHVDSQLADPTVVLKAGLAAATRAANRADRADGRNSRSRPYGSEAAEVDTESERYYFLTT